MSYANLLGCHPIVEWYAKKQPVVLCTDNPGILNATLTDHYALVQRELGLSEQELWALSEKSIEYIFAGEEVKAQLREYFGTHHLNPQGTVLLKM